MTLKMASAQVFKMSVTNNNHPDELFQSRTLSSLACKKKKGID